MFQMPESRFQISDLGFRISDFRFWIWDCRLRILNFRFHISDFRCQISDIGFRISDERLQISDCRLQISELIRAGEPSCRVPGEPGSMVLFDLPLKTLSENPIGSSYLKVFRNLVREKCGFCQSLISHYFFSGGAFRTIFFRPCFLHYFFWDSFVTLQMDQNQALTHSTTSCEPRHPSPWPTLTLANPHFAWPTLTMAKPHLGQPKPKAWLS